MSNGFNSMDDASAYLEHYGVKGQKHGVRQWQNEDGSLTPEGYNHYYGHIREGHRDRAEMLNERLESEIRLEDIKKNRRESAARLAKDMSATAAIGAFSAINVAYGNVPLGAATAAAGALSAKGTANSLRDYIDVRSLEKSLRKNIKTLDRNIDQIEREEDDFIRYVTKYDPYKNSRSIFHQGFDDYLEHSGVKGMHWGERRWQNKDGSLTPEGYIHYYGHLKEEAIAKAYEVGAVLNPRELKYSFRKLVNNPNSTNALISSAAEDYAKRTGTLPTDEKAMRAIETMGIEKHKNAVYDNIDATDIQRFKKYTDAARYSRNVNSYLATGEPKHYAENAKLLKESLSKNKIEGTTVYRSCNFNFSTNGLAKKMETLGDEQLTALFNSYSKNFNGKKINENRVFSTSTSPLFAIDTWRKVNPTAAKTYNSYMIINCKGTSGIYADGKSSKHGALVHTRSNQEVILAPDRLIYRKLAYDKERKMYAITVDAI